jgi:hypothetical protein
MIGNGNQGKLEKLKIHVFEDAELKTLKGIFEAYYNPTSFSAVYGLKYVDSNKASGISKHEMRYSGYEPASFTIELWLDGTGASLPNKIPPISSYNVDLEIDNFKKLIYDYEGKSHRGSYLTLSWGKALAANVVLVSVTINKNLFDANGNTLRATLNCQFKEYSYLEKTEAEMQKKSPDMTHLRVVKQGDRLPLMCEGIYGDDRLYLEVARFNGLSDYRKLVPGQKIFFPPLKSKAQ